MRKLRKLINLPEDEEDKPKYRVVLAEKMLYSILIIHFCKISLFFLPFDQLEPLYSL